ncbi:MAG: unnamed protein product [uncultured Paraburkholderia sp.]|nr:MAG: unnamed protein product [uncultured Paraburkholderia sp.]CAH2804182.1 MAG: unnamed protein product [uncultured Paraburkholderia sp.]CAH2941253.1 MAG: unnamed protein product [uncultured Paraburkholderia sp.]
MSRAVHDTVNKPSVISISWGGPESIWTSQSLAAFNSVLQSAAALGVTVCAASGDSGSSDGAGGGNHVDFPASSPYVLACGGTSLSASGSAITHEVVWNDGPQGGAGGGGVSAAFALPAWQDGLSVVSSAGGKKPLAKRGVPDVAGDASPLTGYTVLVAGTQTVVGGTSAVAPLWAGLIARISAARGAPAGFVNPKLYKAAGVQRHHAGQQRQFRGIRGLGCLHGTRQSQWSEGGRRTIVGRRVGKEVGNQLGNPFAVPAQDVNVPMERS